MFSLPPLKVLFIFLVIGFFNLVGLFFPLQLLFTCLVCFFSQQTQKHYLMQWHPQNVLSTLLLEAFILQASQKLTHQWSGPCTHSVSYQWKALKLLFILYLCIFVFFKYLYGKFPFIKICKNICDDIQSHPDNMGWYTIAITFSAVLNGHRNLFVE